MIACSSREAGSTSMNFYNTSCYDTQAEIFMALKDLVYHYGINRGVFQASTSIPPQQIVLYWKPPGALTWVEKCRTETLPGKTNLQFNNKAYIKFDARDMKSIQLKFVVKGSGDFVPHVTLKYGYLGVLGSSLGGQYEYFNSWCSLEVTLDRLVLAGPRGLFIPLELHFDMPSTISKQFERNISNAIPGNLFLRAEILQPANLGMFLQFRILCQSNDEYYIELYKINQGNLLEIPNAYTLIYRSEENNFEGIFTPVYFQEPRITNGDDERILKLEVYKKKTFAKKGFALTTLSTVYKTNGMLVLPVDKVEAKTKKLIKLVFKLGRCLPLQPIEYYQDVGMKMLRVYAVDFSGSNWNTLLHRKGLHDTESGVTPYEEALELIGNISLEMSAGDSVFYSFGDADAAFVATFPEENHMKSLINTYQNYYITTQLANIQLNDDLDEIMSTNASSACMPTSHCKPMSSSHAVKNKTLITPLLEEITALISTRNAATAHGKNFDYYTVFILTDGQISDVEKAIEVLVELANLPVSLILIGIGQGDFNPLIVLENSWVAPIHGKFICRKFVHVVHFRSIFDWTSSLKYYKMRSGPIDVFRKEILTAVTEHALAYMRVFLPNV